MVGVELLNVYNKERMQKAVFQKRQANRGPRWRLSPHTEALVDRKEKY